MPIARPPYPRTLFFAALITLAASARAADLYWRTDGTGGGTWTSSSWSNLPSATGGTPWTAGSHAIFQADSTLTFASATVGNVTVAADKTVTITQNGTLSLGGLVSTFDVESGATLTWQSQTVTANSTAGITKTGGGLLDLGALTFTTNMTGGFTLNAGTVAVSGNKALGNGALTLNGGSLKSSKGNSFAVSSITIGGDFTFLGTGNDNFGTGNISLGAATRTITNATTGGSRQFLGAISGTGGITFAGNGTALIYLGNTGNDFGGNISINGGEVVANGNGALGSGNAITLDGGRLTLAGMDTSGTIIPLAAASISSTRTIFIGDGTGTSISVQGATGITTFAGLITNASGKAGSWAKLGAGTLKLGGTNSYTGTTSVNEGTLVINGDQSAATGNVIVAKGAKLGGTGMIGGSVSINQDGILGAGDPTVGTGVGKQTFRGGLSLNSGSIFEWSLAETPKDDRSSGVIRGTDYDAINTASLGQTKDAIFRVVLQGSQDFSEKFWDSPHSWANLFMDTDARNPLEYASVFGGGIQYYNSAGGNLGIPASQGSFTLNGHTLAWTPVPEPTGALAGLLLGGALLRRKRSDSAGVHPQIS